MPLPNDLPSGETPLLHMITSSVQRARLYGQLNAKVTMLRYKKTELSEISEVVTNFSGQLQALWDTLPPWATQSELPPHPSAQPLLAQITLETIFYQQYSHYVTLLRIHSLLIHPWNAIPVNIEPGERDQYNTHQNSTHISIEATRKFVS